MEVSAAEPTLFDSQPAHAAQASVGNPVALGADDGGSGQGLGGGESAEEADLPPASELLPKLHLALKTAGHGYWPRLAVPLLLLPNIGAWGIGYYCLHLYQINAAFRDIMFIYWIGNGFVVAWSTFLLHQHIARADGTGALDVLEKLPISSEGAQDLKHAEFWAGNAPTSPIVMTTVMLLMEWAEISSGWHSEPIRYIATIGTIIGSSFGNSPQSYTSVGIDLACCAIVRDQLRQTARRLRQLVSSSVASQTEPAFDFRATMAELHRLLQHSVECERTSGSILINVLYCYVGTGSLFIYGAATSDPGAVAIRVILLGFAGLWFAQAIDLLLGPLSVTAGASSYW